MSALLGQELFPAARREDVERRTGERRVVAFDDGEHGTQRHHLIRFTAERVEQEAVQRGLVHRETVRVPVGVPVLGGPFLVDQPLTQTSAQLPVGGGRRRRAA